MGGERAAEPIEEWVAPVGAEASGGASSFVVSPVPVVRRGRGLLVAGAVCALVVAVAAIAVLAGPPTGTAGASPATTSVARIPGSPAPAGSPAADVPASPAPSAGPAAPAAPSPAATLALAPVLPTTARPFPNEEEAAILAALPIALARTCVRGGTSSDARLAGFVGPLANAAGTNPPLFAPGHSLGGVTCHPPTGAARLYVMAPGSFSPAPGDAYLGYVTGPHDVPRGSCVTDRQAYERWFGPRGTGLLVCMNSRAGRPWIYFSFNDGRYLAFATRDDADDGALLGWWQELKTFLP